MLVYQRIAQLVDAYHRCIEKQNTEWQRNHEDAITELAKDCLPRGSGFDCGTTVNLDKSTSNRLVLDTSYHHMDENGFYDGWTDHSIIVTPSLAFDFEMRITGRDRDGWKDYASDVFYWALLEDASDS